MWNQVCQHLTLSIFLHCFKCQSFSYPQQARDPLPATLSGTAASDLQLLGVRVATQLSRAEGHSCFLRTLGQLSPGFQKNLLWLVSEFQNASFHVPPVIPNGPSGNFLASTVFLLLSPFSTLLAGLCIFKKCTLMLVYWNCRKRQRLMCAINPSSFTKNPSV